MDKNIASEQKTNLEKTQENLIDDLAPKTIGSTLEKSLGEELREAQKVGLKIEDIVEKKGSAKEKPIIKIRNLRKVYKIGKEKVVALNKIDLDIYKGEICCILGTSGSGKSTLLNMMAGLEKPTKGYVDIKDERVTKMNEKTLASFRQKHVGFIFQSYNLIPTLTAEENVSLPLTFRGVPKHIRDKRAKKYLKAVELENYIKHKPTQMSGGQQQRVGIARAFTGEPSILFADEPTGNLDSKTTSKIMGIMLDLAEKNDQTMIMVTHDREIAQYADKVVYVLDGNIVKVEVKEKEDVRRYVHHAKKIAEEQKEKK